MQEILIVVREKGREYISDEGIIEFAAKTGKNIWPMYFGIPGELKTFKDEVNVLPEMYIGLSCSEELIRGITKTYSKMLDGDVSYIVIESEEDLNDIRN
jgi:hypothetical protein